LCFGDIQGYTKHCKDIEKGVYMATLHYTFTGECFRTACGHVSTFLECTQDYSKTECKACISSIRGKSKFIGLEPEIYIANRVVSLRKVKECV
jgi:hypothetical protein